MMTASRGSSPVRALVAAMVLMAACYAGAIACYQSFVTRIHHDTDEILADAVPCTQRLIAVRTGMRRLDGAVSTALSARLEHGAWDGAPIALARRNMRRDLEAFRLLPFHPHEAELYDVALAHARHLDAVLEALEAALSRQDLADAQRLHAREWREAGDRFDASIRNLIVFNVQHVAQSAARISKWWHLSSSVGVGLGAINVLLTAGVTMLAARFIRRQSRQQDQRIAELEMFADRVAHELISPIAGVRLALVEIEARPGGAGAEKLAGSALRSVRRVQQVVDALLRFALAGARPEANARARVREVVTGVVEERRGQAEAAEIEIAVEDTGADAAAGDRVVRCAPGVLGIVLGNLLDNALKYMSESAAERRIVVRMATVGERVRLEVEDSGPGLPPGFEQVAFDPYVRGPARGRPGLGLGLGTVKRLVEAHGGSVGVESGGRTGTGALFWIELEAVNDAAMRASVDSGAARDRCLG